MGTSVAEGMPTAQDQSVPSAVAGSAVGAAPPLEAPPIDVQAIPENVRTYLESQFRSGYVPATDLSNLQSTKDTEIAAATRAAEQAQTQFQVAQAQVASARQAFNKYVADVISGAHTPHPNDAATFQLSMQAAAGQVSFTRAQAAAEHRNWESTHAEGLQSTIQAEAQGGDGLPPITPDVIANDAEVQRLDREIRAAALLDAKEFYKNPQHGQRAMDLTRQLGDRISRIAQIERMKAVAQPAVAEMQRVNQNLDRQVSRGVQTQAMPGMTSLTGAYDSDAAWKQAAAAVASRYGIDPSQVEASHYEEVYQTWAPGYDEATRNPRR